MTEKYDHLNFVLDCALATICFDKNPIDKFSEEFLFGNLFFKFQGIGGDPEWSIDPIEGNGSFFYRIEYENSLENSPIIFDYSKNEVASKIYDILFRKCHASAWQKSEINRIFKKYNLDEIVALEDSSPQMSNKKWWERLSNYLFNP